MAAKAELVASQRLPVLCEDLVPAEIRICLAYLILRKLPPEGGDYRQCARILNESTLLYTSLHAWEL